MGLLSRAGGAALDEAGKIDGKTERREAERRNDGTTESWGAGDPLSPSQQLALRGLRAFAQELVLPLAQAVGDQWALGKIPIAAEHVASEVVLHALKGGLRASRGTGPLVVGACLPGERHEWGFLATLAVAQESGWRIHYLGADLPVEAVMEAAWKLRPRSVAFSGSDPSLVRSLLPALGSLPGKLPPKTLAGIGGGGAEPHARALRRHGYRVGVEAFAVGRSGGQAVGRSDGTKTKHRVQHEPPSA